MNKEELLKKAKEESKGLDEREMIHLKEASAAGMAIGGALCLLINLVCLHIDGIDPLVRLSCWVIYTGMQAADSIFKAVRIRKKDFMWFGILYGVLFLAFLVLFVIELIKK